MVTGEWNDGETIEWCKKNEVKSCRRQNRERVNEAKWMRVWGKVSQEIGIRLPNRMLVNKEMREEVEMSELLYGQKRIHVSYLP